MNSPQTGLVVKVDIARTRWLAALLERTVDLSLLGLFVRGVHSISSVRFVDSRPTGGNDDYS